MSDSIQQKTFKLELCRSICNGILETAGATFILLFLIKVFNGSPSEKGLLAAASSIGLLSGPFIIHWVKALKITVSKAISLLFSIGAIVFLLAAVFPYKDPLIISGITVGIVFSSAVPLFTHIYQNNYPAGKRGSLYSRANTFRVATSATFGLAAGTYLNNHLNHFPYLLLIYSLCLAISALLISYVPSGRLHSDPAHKLLHGFRYIKSDRVFRHTLICWMFMGFGNLMMIPLRVDYLANPRYGVNLAPSDVALFVVVIPALARLVMSPIWGRLFDQVNFFWLRIILNMSFLLGIITFFTSDTHTGFAIGAVIFGISLAGGDIAWNLWVTKFAPHNLVADYMAIHTFMTGVRGVAAPFTAFYLAERFSLASISLLSGGLIFISVILLYFEAVRKEDLIENIKV